MKKLRKSKTDRFICGVCGGLGEYFGIDSTIFRLLFAVITVIGGSGVLIYLIAVFLMSAPADGDN